jgi:D-glycero-beta-D-manno-heptose 1-phosphate adenylyltransferase
VKTCMVPSGLTVEEVKKLITPVLNEGKTVVTTNGCFDLLHAGHVRYLYDAAQFGDILIVGINSDESVSRLKGSSRPIQNENDRAFLVGQIRSVDYTFIFSESDPCRFLEVLQPAIHVKGGDYRAEQLPETEVVTRNGGRIEIVPFVRGYSTSLLINKIHSMIE